MAETKKLIPKRRFKKFQNSEAWVQRKVKDVFTVTRGDVLAATKTRVNKSKDAQYPVYSSQTKHNGLMGYYNDYLYENAITWTTDGANAGTVNYRAGKFYCTNVCGVLLSNEIEANQMMAEALNNVAKGHVSYVGNPKLMNNVMSSIEIHIPTTHDERNQISEFFKKLDKLITLHQRKLDKIKSTKKAYLSEMFPAEGESKPKRRFKGFTEDWKLCKLGDLGSVSMCKRVFKDQTKPNGDVPFYKIGTFGSEPDAYISRELFEEYKAKFSYPNKGSILISASGSIGRIVEFSGKDEYFQDSNIIWLEHNNRISDSFLRHLYSIVKWSGIEGTTIKRLYNDNVLKTEITLPSVEEQEKISAYLNNLDNLITLHQQKLDKLKYLKKSYLNEMFI
jgi:type I restriction enzyme, S subunit